jgi:hypothetical protein
MASTSRFTFHNMRGETIRFRALPLLAYRAISQRLAGSSNGQIWCIRHPTRSDTAQRVVTERKQDVYDTLAVIKAMQSTPGVFLQTLLHYNLSLSLSICSLDLWHHSIPILAISGSRLAILSKSRVAKYDILSEPFVGRCPLPKGRGTLLWSRLACLDCCLCSLTGCTHCCCELDHAVTQALVEQKVQLDNVPPW